MRHSRLDELPQLWHVFTGDMSLVGPRPAPTNMGHELLCDNAQRHTVRPGMLGLAQTKGRLEAEDALKLDLEYVERAGVATDLRIILDLPRTAINNWRAPHCNPQRM